MTQSDALLIERIRAGETAAADELLRRYFRTCFLVALSAVGDPNDAEDVCQDAFIRALERLDECRTPSLFRAWLVTIVRNVGHNHRRHERLRQGEPITDDAVFPSSDRTDSMAERGELRRLLLGALAALGTRQREVVLLHDLEGLRHREIAFRLGVSEEMSRRHLSDARARLRTLLGDYATLSLDHD